MQFKRQNYEIEKFTKDSSSIICGTCFVGTILPKEFLFGSEQSFSSVLICTKCNKKYTCIGYYKYFQRTGKYLTKTEVSSSYSLPKEKVFYPYNFIPTLSLFIYPKAKLSIEFNNELDLAFAHFWHDTNASSNKIRRAVEYLMDHLNVPLLKTLDKRIEKFKEVNPDVAEKLMAIKHIGNAGSHKDFVTKEDLFDAFEILDYALSKLYPSDQEQGIHEKAREINSIKGLRSKK